MTKGNQRMKGQQEDKFSPKDKLNFPLEFIGLQGQGPSAEGLATPEGYSWNILVIRVSVLLSKPLRPKRTTWHLKALDAQTPIIESPVLVRMGCHFQTEFLAMHSFGEDF